MSDSSLRLVWVYPDLLRTRCGNGNGTGDGTEGAYNETVFGTYTETPVF